MSVYGAGEQQYANKSLLDASVRVLRANGKAYERLARSALSLHERGESEAALSQAARAAELAVRSHTGRFSDGALENMATAIGARLESPVDVRTRNANRGPRRRVLHVATTVYGVGGHTRMLHHWMENDRDSSHSLVLLSQQRLAVPAWLRDSLAQRHGVLHQLADSLSILEKARQLRTLARQEADIVVLHQHPQEIISSVAFAVTDLPPVLQLNHADHCYWLGSGVADVIVNLRSQATEVSANRRSARQNTTLPIPVTVPTAAPDRATSRAALGIPDNQLVILSVGRGVKYRPCGPFDFFATMNGILERHSNAHLYVVGAAAEELPRQTVRDLHARVHLTREIEDPSHYRAAADVYLESFPFGSNTALLEAALAGIPIVPAYAPLFPLLVAGNDSLNGVATNAENETAYTARIDELLLDATARSAFGRKVQSCVMAEHVGDAWLAHLEALYQRAGSLSHSVQAIPLTQCVESSGDVGLALRSFMADDRMSVLFDSRDGELAALAYAVDVAREVKDFAGARQHALRLLWASPWSRAAWRVALPAMLGSSASRVAAALRWRLTPAAAETQRAQ